MFSCSSVRHASTIARSAQSILTEQKTTTSNGLTIASQDRHGAVAQLVLAFRAGSRFESVSQKGLSHHIRNFVGRDTQQFQGVPLLWSTAAIGANMVAFTSRDLFGVRITVPREFSNVALSILGHVASQPSFKPWELEEIKNTLLTDNAYKQPSDVVFEDIHRAAYRNGGFGNSIYAAKRYIGKYGMKELRHFASERLVSDQGILFGINIDHEHLVSYGENHAPIESGKGSAAKESPYIGGEVRRETSGNYAHMIIAGSGADLSDVPALATQAVLLSVLGQEKQTKFGGKNGSGILSKAIANNGVVSSFQASYQGNGLVGAYLVSESANAGVAVRSIVNALRSFKIDDIQGAKNVTRNNILLNTEKSMAYSIDRSAQLLCGVTDGALLSAIEKVTASDVQLTAKKLASKLSIASYGKIDHVPYLDQL